MGSSQSPFAEFTRRTLLVAAVAAGVFLLWQLRHVALLLFLTILLAVLLRAVAHPLSRWTGAPARLAVLGAALGLATAFAAIIWFFGMRVQSQVAELSSRLPAAWRDARAWLNSTAPGTHILDDISTLPESVGLQSVLSLRGYLSSAGSIATTTVLIVVASIYLAAEPAIYRSIIVALAPAARREQLSRAIDAMAATLRAWILAQLAGMFVVGLATGIGLAIIGVPAPLALGVIAALADFVPLIGPVVASIPALLLAASMGFAPLAWTAFLVVAIQQFEGNILLPLLQRKMVSLPPQEHPKNSGRPPSRPWSPPPGVPCDQPSTRKKALSSRRPACQGSRSRARARPARRSG